MKHLELFEDYQKYDIQTGIRYRKINIKELEPYLDYDVNRFRNAMKNLGIGAWNIDFKGLTKKDLLDNKYNMVWYVFGNYFDDNDVFYNLFKKGDDIVIELSRKGEKGYGIFKFDVKEKDKRMFHIDFIGWIDWIEVAKNYHHYNGLKNTKYDFSKTGYK